jgi:uncharacterized damage-inducible protein DinB
MRRPDASEHAAYYSTYIDRVPDRAVLEVLAEAPAALARLLEPVGPDDEGFAYAPGKWSFREVLAHVLDTERVFAYRALHIARRDPAELPGMDQTVWAAAAGAERRSLADLLAEFADLRAADTRLFASFDEAALDRRGVASGFAVTVRALVFIAAGHELHHRAILAERYLSEFAAESGGESGG